MAGDNGRGDRLYQLDRPTDAARDPFNNDILISDSGTRRSMQWHLNYDRTPEQSGVFIDHVGCYGTAMNNCGSIYFSDIENHVVVRYNEAIGE